MVSIEIYTITDILKQICNKNTSTNTFFDTMKCLTGSFTAVSHCVYLFKLVMMSYDHEELILLDGWWK
jgi:hypothetical protein